MSEEVAQEPSVSPSYVELVEENQTLQQELNKIEDLLSTARAERDEIVIRYNALHDSVSNFFLLLEKYTNSRRK